MKKTFLVILIVVIPILSFGAESQMDNTEIATITVNPVGSLAWFLSFPIPQWLWEALKYVLVSGVFTAGFSLYFRARIRHHYDKKLEVVRHEYSEKLELYRFDLKMREQAAKVAELLAEARDGDTTITSKRAKKLNKLTWELSLWLPADIVRELTKNLNLSPSPGLRQILVDVWKLLRNDDDDDLIAADIQWFEQKPKLLL